MFASFFPKPKRLLVALLVWVSLCIAAWYGGLKAAGDHLGVVLDAELAPLTASGDVWFYQYFVVSIAVFVGGWQLFSRHPWRRWSVGGSGLIVLINWFLVELDVRINDWFGSFYDLVQKALAHPGTVNAVDYYLKLATFLEIALVYVIVATLFRFFISHFIFRWRTAMNAHYTRLWQRLRHIEGAAQRVQEDTMRFASISEDLGVSLMDSIMTLVAFLPLLWMLSAHVEALPIIGPVSQGLVFVAVVWSIIGTGLVAVAGIRLPGIQFRNQRVEAAYRKELVYGEDVADRAQPPTLRELFDAIRANYFRLYANYLYFNLVRISYLQIGSLVPYVALGPSVIGGTLTLGIMQQIVRAFGRVESSFQYLVNSWSTIIELMSIHKRLRAFENAIGGRPEQDLDRANRLA